MKRALVAVVACAALGAWGQQLTKEQHVILQSEIAGQTCKATSDDAYQEIRELVGGLGLHHYYGQSALEFLRKKKYQNLTLFDLAMHYCIPLPKPLGTIDSWRFESCMTDAAKAPTSQGVGAGMQVCRKKFGQ